MSSHALTAFRLRILELIADPQNKEIQDVIAALTPGQRSKAWAAFRWLRHHHYIWEVRNSVMLTHKGKTVIDLKQKVRP